MEFLAIYLVVINTITFALFVADKKAAQHGNDPRKRQPEKRLLGLCLIGGSIGGIIAMRVAHHKTRKWYFAWGLPAFLVLDIGVIALCLHMLGMW